MLITNLGSLKAELGRYMFHQRFQPDYDTAIANFEAVANRRLRVRQMEHTVALTMNVHGSVALPSDYLLWRGVMTYDIGPPGIRKDELDYVHPVYLDAAGDKKVFSIKGESLTIRPIDTTPNGYVLDYYQKIPTINGTAAGDNASNWLLAAHPDLYLHGCLFELFALGRNGEAAVAHKQLRDEKIGELIQLSALTTGATSDKVRSETAEYF